MYFLDVAGGSHEALPTVRAGFARGGRRLHDDLRGAAVAAHARGFSREPPGRDDPGPSPIREALTGGHADAGRLTLAGGLAEPGRDPDPRRDARAERGEHRLPPRRALRPQV